MAKNALTIKEALYNTIHRHPTLSVEAIAEQINMTTSYLYRSALPDPDTDGPKASGVRFPLKQVVPLMRTTGDFQVLFTICEQVGYAAIPIPETINCSCEDLQCKAIEAAAEFGDLMKEVQEATKDGKYKAHEQERVEKEGWEAIRAIMSVMKYGIDK